MNETVASDSMQRLVALKAALKAKGLCVRLGCPDGVSPCLWIINPASSHLDEMIRCRRPADGDDL